MDKNNKSIIIYLSVLIVLLLAANFWYLISNNNRWGDVWEKVSQEWIDREDDYSDRLQIVSPIEGQVIERTNPVITIQGKMQGFFEGVVNYRLLNEEDEVVIEGFVMAKEDNYEQSAEFEDQLYLSEDLVIKLNTKAVLEFIEISPKDGKEILVERTELFIN